MTNTNIYEIEEKMKPCPFCTNEGAGVTGLYVCNFSQESGVTQPGCFVTCDCCQADGPWRPYIEDEKEAVKAAVEAWNSRTYHQFNKTGL